MLPEPLRPVAHRAARKLVGEGARAVVVVGSHARGEAGPESDLDLLAVGPTSYLPRLDLYEDQVVSASMQPFETHRESFRQPELLCTAVPGWRDALVLHDPEGLAAGLAREAQEWSWAPHKQRCDEWVAEKITGYAEEVFKLVAAFENGRRPAAAVQRSLLAVHLAPVLAVHRRLLYGSENVLWELLSRAMGEEWRRNQNAALATGGEAFETSCTAALNLYEIAADEVYSLFDSRQKPVVEHARTYCQRG